jgi:hypothetical protein
MKGSHATTATARFILLHVPGTATCQMSVTQCVSWLTMHLPCLSCCLQLFTASLFLTGIIGALIGMRLCDSHVSSWLVLVGWGTLEWDPDLLGLWCVTLCHDESSKALSHLLSHHDGCHTCVHAKQGSNDACQEPDRHPWIPAWQAHTCDRRVDPQAVSAGCNSDRHCCHCWQK